VTTPLTPSQGDARWAEQTAPPRHREPVPLEPRREPERRRPFHRGAHAPFAIRWFGMSALVGHLRHLAAVAAASNQLDLRDWMRPDSAAILLERMGSTLGAAGAGATLAERLGRPVWIDFVADTGDDHDVSVAVGRMIFADYRLAADAARVLPRGDILLFGGDTAYPAATASELERRLVRPWNRVLRTRGDDGRQRVLLGIPGNHDWYDGLDGFARLFRRNILEGLVEPEPGDEDVPAEPSDGDGLAGRVEGAIQRHLHVDEVGESLRLAKETVEAIAALLGGSKIRRPTRLALRGYAPAQEASYWALPLAPGFDLWGVDRQLRDADFRQRVFFARRRAETPAHKVLFVAPDPALAYGEPNEPGARLLDATGFTLRSDRLLYLTGDAHHYERHHVGGSLHVIAGGGGAFLHGTRIAPTAGSRPPEVVYPDKRTSRRIALGMPLRLATGTAGFLPHATFALLAALEIVALRRGPLPCAVTTGALTLFAIFALSLAVRARHQRPVTTWTVATVVGLMLGLGPLGLRAVLPRVLLVFGDLIPVAVGHAFLGSFVLGLFLLVLALTGLEHHQGFSVLGHPGFRHFVRLCVHPSGSVEGFVIGKDDPIGPGRPVLIDHFTWS
jgi:hypothetical protein